jgi:hypothetical protein
MQSYGDDKMTTDEALARVQFTVNQEGSVTGVFLPVTVWQALIEVLEDAEDLASARAMLPKLRQGPEVSGALRWEDIREEWLGSVTSTDSISGHSYSAC